MDIAGRIANERKRLGLSQAAFADALGVSLSSQKRYEKGEREFDASYLDALKNAGVDTHYIVFGTREDAYESTYFLAAEWLLREIADKLLLDPDAFKDAVEKLTVAANKMLESDDQRAMNTLCESLVLEAFKKSALFDGAHDKMVLDLDVGCLSRIIEDFETAQNRLCLDIPTKKKAQALALLWRAAKGGNEITTVMIDDTVKLAAC